MPTPIKNPPKSHSRTPGLLWGPIWLITLSINLNRSIARTRLGTKTEACPIPEPIRFYCLRFVLCNAGDFLLKLRYLLWFKQECINLQYHSLKIAMNYSSSALLWSCFLHSTCRERISNAICDSKLYLLFFNKCSFKKRKWKILFYSKHFSTHFFFHLFICSLVSHNMSPWISNGRLIGGEKN